MLAVWAKHLKLAIKHSQKTCPYFNYTSLPNRPLKVFGSQGSFCLVVQFQLFDMKAPIVRAAVIEN